jgi:hypothetical protein
MSEGKPSESSGMEPLAGEQLQELQAANAAQDELNGTMSPGRRCHSTPLVPPYSRHTVY